MFHMEAKQGIKAELAIPVSVDGIVIATIHFQSSKESVEYKREDITNILHILADIRQPLLNMKMYLAARHLNEALLKKIEQKEKELQESKKTVEVAETFRIQEKEIIGKSESMKRVLLLIEKFAASDVNGILVGEAGTGKEMIARRAHCRSPRREGGFVSIDCTSLPEHMLEIELFGQENQEFGQGHRVKKGLIENAHGGTLFLNNIDALSIGLQAKLVRFMSDKVTFRIGGSIPYRAEVRIAAATTKEMSKLVEENLFREDLYYALNTVQIDVPALRDRQEDIEVLSNFFLNVGKPQELHKSLSPCVVSTLAEYTWPGNVRELQNVMERAYILSDGMIVEKSHLAENVSQAPAKEEKSEVETNEFTEMTLDELEKRHIIKTLEFLSGNKTKTARTLGITVKTLYNKLHSYGMIQAKEA